MDEKLEGLLKAKRYDLAIRYLADKINPQKPKAPRAKKPKEY